MNEVEKKITDHDHHRYIITPEFNKLTAENFAARLSQANLARKSDIANFVKKIDYSFFLGRIYFTSSDGLQIIFVYQPTYNVIRYLNTSTEYIISWRSKGVYNTKLNPIKKDYLK